MRIVLGATCPSLVASLAIGCAPVAATSPDGATSAPPPIVAPTPVTSSEVAPTNVAPPAKASASGATAASPPTNPPPKPPPPEPPPPPPEPAPRPTGPSVRLVGPCVDTEVHAAREMLKYHPDGKIDDWREFVTIHATPDLDGDGNADQIRFGGATGMNVRVLLYVMRGRCGHHVGTIDANVTLSPLATSNRGLLDVGGPSACPVDCCPEVFIRRWKFDGARYQLADEHAERRDCGGYVP